MSKVNSLAKRSDKGLPTSDHFVVAMIDLQPQMLFGGSRFDRQTIFNHNVALAKAARAFGVPIILSSVQTKGFSGSIWPQVLAAFGNPTPIERRLDELLGQPDLRCGNS